MIYAELIGTEIGEGILDRGVFFTLSEYLPYRAKGWSGSPDIDAAADERIEELQNTSEFVLKYMAPMHKTGEDARYELHRRRHDA